MNALEAERAKIAHDMQQLRAQVSGAEIDEPHLRELLALAMQDDAAVLSIVVRVEVGKDEIAVWTLLDADPNGDFDFAEDGVPITPSKVAPSYNNSGCPVSGTTNYYNIVTPAGLLLFYIARPRQRDRRS